MSLKGLCWNEFKGLSNGANQKNDEKPVRPVR
jgi:hypothetical protein